MGKKNSGGKNFKKQKKESNNFQRELIFAEDDQAYARIIKKLGDGRFDCECIGLDKNLIGHIRGSMRKRVWINIGDIVLVSTRDFDETKCDIIHKYNSDEASCLKGYGELPSNFNLNATPIELSNEQINGEAEDLGFEFEDI